jgi:acetyl-CoA carboxylase biotin carboxyl carrier protein
MDIRKIKKMIELLEESGIAEIEIKEGEETLRIARVMPAQQWAQSRAPSPPSGPPGMIQDSPPPNEPASAPARSSAEEHIATAPMVGTYYSAPAPGAKPFVEIGDQVEVGQVLCVIEAMKMMNQIESEKAGKIKAILLKNGEPVEFGQPLFIIQP